MNFIEELFNGKIRPFDQTMDYKNGCDKAVKDLLESEKSLTDFLNALPNATKEQELLLQMINAQGELSDFTEIQRFICGFRLGARFVMDTFVTSQNDIT